ncbi:hypothetical protein SSX86_013362 [Deinandra increscens subsp. villosa]|uniref:Uncharacterized protein n=1 Tax=Deinandra increscens subsp. villosa TaxID=3103831 RepID=A0AAP0D7H8_9ASTR
MVARTYLVILFFWALLTIVTPILVHMSSHPNPLDLYDEEVQNCRRTTLWWRKKCECTETFLDQPSLDHPSISAPTPTPTLTTYDTRIPEFFMMQISCMGLSRKVLVRNELQ